MTGPVCRCRIRWVESEKIKRKQINTSKPVLIAANEQYTGMVCLHLSIVVTMMMTIEVNIQMNDSQSSQNNDL